MEHAEYRENHQDFTLCCCMLPVRANRDRCDLNITLCCNLYNSQLQVAKNPSRTVLFESEQISCCHRLQHKLLSLLTLSNSSSLFSPKFKNLFQIYFFCVLINESRACTCGMCHPNFSYFAFLLGKCLRDFDSRTWRHYGAKL